MTFRCQQSIADETSWQVRSSFGVPYVLSGKDVAVDTDHHRSLLELHHRVSPKEIVVGW